MVRTRINKADYEPLRKVDDGLWLASVIERETAEGLVCLQGYIRDDASLERVREWFIRNVIEEYDGRPWDEGGEVNVFDLTRDGELLTRYWIGRDLRTSLEGDVVACSAVSDTYVFDVRELGIALPLDCNKFLAALARLRQYAYTAFNVTSMHIREVCGLESAEEILRYDYRAGYPERLSFDVEELM